MGTETNKDELFRATVGLGLEGNIFVPTPPLDTVDLALRTPCYQAFFDYVTDGSSLLEKWHSLQDRVLNYKQNAQGIPRDLYLAFVLAPDTKVPWVVLQDLASDSMVCKKIVLRPKAGKLQESLSKLPFLTIEFPQPTSWSGADSLLGAMESLDYPSDVLSLFRMRLAPNTIADRLLQLDIPQSVPSPSAAQYRGDLKPRTQSSVRLESLFINDFRGIRKMDLNLSAPITVIYGRNGTGKTSIFQAIEWALLGEVERLEEKCADDLKPTSPYVNLFSTERVARVALTLKAAYSTKVQRSWIDKDSAFELLLDDQSASNEHELLDVLCGDQSKTLDIRHLRRLLRTTSFLSQATIKQFLSHEPEERYWALSYLLGTHDLTQLIDKLEQVRVLFETKVTLLNEELQVLTNRSQLIGSQIDAKQSVSPMSHQGQELSEVLSTLCGELRSHLEILSSPFLDLVPQASSNLEQIRSALSVISEWINTAQRENQLRHQKLTAAKDIASSLGPLSQQNIQVRSAFEDTEPKCRHLQLAFQSAVEARDRTASELAHIVAEMKRAEIERERADRILTALQQRETFTVFQHATTREIAGISEQLVANVTEQKAISEALGISFETAKSEQSELSDCRGQLKRLSEAETLSREWARILLDRPQLEQQLRKAISDESDLSRRKSTLLIEKSSLVEDLTGTAATLNAEIESLERHRQLIVGLQEFVKGSACPLCGHDWKTPEELLLHIKSQTEWESERARELRSKRRDLSERLENVGRNIDTLDQELTRAATAKKETADRLSHLREFYANLRQSLQKLGIDLTDDRSLVASIAGVRQALEQRIATLVEGDKQSQARVQTLQAQQRALASTAAELEKRQAFLTDRLADSESSSTLVIKTLNDLGFDPQSGQGAISAILQTHSERLTHLLKRRDELSARSRDAEGTYEGARIALEALEKKRHDLQRTLQDTTRAIEDARFQLLGSGISPDAAEEQISASILDLERRTTQLEVALDTVSRIEEMSSLLIARRELSALTEQQDQLTTEIDAVSARLSKHQKWFEHMSTIEVIINATKAESDRWQLQQYEPTINQLYERLSNHPIFRSFKIDIDLQAKSVTIGIAVDHEIIRDRDLPGTLAPQRYLSEAQSNTVALSIFLSHSFQQRWSRFVTLLIDDPVQNMDDFNAAGFIDCVRAFADLDRQFVISTCDVNFYRLLLAKLRCLNSNGPKRFRAYRLEGISPEGPELVEDTH